MNDIQPYGAADASGLWVFLEQEEGELVGVSLELLGKSRELADRLGTPLTGILLGHQVRPLADQAFAAGADQVLLADHPDLAVYNTYTRVVSEAIAERKPSIFLLGATPDGRDLAGRLAVRVQTGLTADCTGMDVDPENGLLKGDVVGFGGGIVATILCPDMRPQMATVRPGIFPAPELDPKRKGTMEEIPVRIREEDKRVKVLERVTAAGLDITKAPCIVAAGRGIGGDLSLVEELARLFGGEIGATRVACDEGWIERERQIGQTGVVTRPKLAICCGISGAIHFTVGIEAAETVVAINTDEEAPIFEAADYCIVDDLFAVLPPLIEQLREAANGGKS
jgi:electron transfer flavoprotein alpha subunit